MTITLNKIIDLFKKENRPLLGYEIRKHFDISEHEEVKIYDEKSKSILEPDKLLSYLPKIYILIMTDSGIYKQRDEAYRFTIEQLEEFWSNEIAFLLRTSNNELKISELVRELGKQLVSYYNLTDPLGESFKITSDAGLGDSEHRNGTLLKFLKKKENVFYFRSKYPDASVHQDQTHMIGLIEWKGKVLDNDRKIIRNQMLSILRNHPKKEMLLEDLVYGTNRAQLKTLIPKPYSESLIKEILLENQDRFIFDSLRNTFRNSDDVEYIISYFKSEIRAYQDFTIPQMSSGLLAFIFIGKEFPLEEAYEYIKTRPILYIAAINNYGKYGLPPLYHFDDKLKKHCRNLLPFAEELKKYLTAILNEKEDLEQWLMQNIAFSYYEENDDQIRLLKNKIIEKLSPVFNVEENAGNLFQFTLSKKLEEFYTQNPDMKPTLDF